MHTVYDVHRREREQLVEITEQLIGEYPVLPAGSVMRCVARCREHLARTGISHGLAAATEAAARRALESKVAAARAA